MIYVLYQIENPCNYYSREQKNVSAVFTSKESADAYISSRELEMVYSHNLDELKDVEINPK